MVRAAAVRPRVTGLSISSGTSAGDPQQQTGPRRLCKTESRGYFRKKVKHLGRRKYLKSVYVRVYFTRSPTVFPVLHEVGLMADALGRVRISDQNWWCSQPLTSPILPQSATAPVAYHSPPPRRLQPPATRIHGERGRGVSTALPPAAIPAAVAQRFNGSNKSAGAVWGGSFAGLARFGAKR